MHQIAPESAEALPDQAAVTDKGVLASYDLFSTVPTKISRDTLEKDVPPENHTVPAAIRVSRLVEEVKLSKEFLWEAVSILGTAKHERNIQATVGADSVQLELEMHVEDKLPPWLCCPALELLGKEGQ
jgi:hypothetical protein